MRGTREAIIHAAMTMFAEKGYAGASIREICQAAGVTKPVLYYHFENKEHLFQELMVDCFGYYMKILLRASQCDGDLRKRLVRVVYSDFQAVKADPARIRFVLRMVFAPEGQRPNFNFIEEMEKQRKLISRIFEDGMKGGQPRGNARHLATALMGMNLIATLENVFTGSSTLTRKNAESFVDILLQSCAVH